MPNNLYQRLCEGPCVLLLGQNYLSGDLGVNPILQAIRLRHPNAPEAGGLSNFLSILASENPDSFLPWIHRKSDEIPIGEGLHLISEFPWNHVYCSAIDNVWIRSFKKAWRTVHGIYNEEFWPQEIRDTHHLNGTFLFGCVDKEDKAQRPPLDEFALDVRYQIATSLLKRIADILTPRGTLIIEGWDPDGDWLTSKELYPALNSLTEDQVYLFSTTNVARNDRRIQKLQTDSKIHLLDEGLAQFLQQGMNLQALKLGDPGLRLPGRQVTIDSKPFTVPKDLRMGIEGQCLIFDDNLTIPPRKLDSSHEYAAFLRFLESPVRLNHWDSFARGFAFERDYYKQLLAESLSILRKHQISKAPIILHGETGTGKTVSLGLLAYSMASAHGFPVLYIERAARDIDWMAVDRYLKWIEDNGAISCLIVWDGMRSESEYAQVVSRLADRARKVVLVGSSYLISDSTKARCVEANRLFNPSERDRFLSFLERFASDWGRTIKEQGVQIDDAFLVALFRLLPSTRPNLRSGVVAEVAWAQEDILSRLKHLPVNSNGMNTLASALELAGYKFQPENTWMEQTRLGGEQLTEIQELFALVMVPGRYGCSVPVELLLSALNKAVSAPLLIALKTTVLVWNESRSGDLSVAPRHPLEAQLYLERVFGGSQDTEVDSIRKLISGLKRPGSAVGSELGIDFIVELLRLIGPNSSVKGYRDRFRRHTIKFAESLANLRKEKNLISPRLILQEASFSREAVVDPQCILTLDEREELLGEAIKALLQARDIPDLSNRLQSSLNEELAACYGSVLHIETRSEDADKFHLMSIFKEAKQALEMAWSNDPSNVHSTVTLGWITRRMLSHGKLSNLQIAEVSAALLGRFDEAETEGMDYVQKERFLAERMRVMESLGDMSVADDIFQMLLDQGSKVGYFLRARQIIGEWPQGETSSSDETKLTSALLYLESKMEEISNDSKCMNLYFRVWWLLKVKAAPFSRERMVLPFNESEWKYCLYLTHKLLILHEEAPTPSLRFLNALANFHGNSPKSALEQFNAIGSDLSVSLGGRRLRKMFIASSQGNPVLYNGTVQQNISQHEFGKIWINEIRLLVNITPRDFDRPSLQKDESLADFHLAFSYTGPVAQSPALLRASKHGH